MQDFIAIYGLWLLIALAAIAVIAFLFREKRKDNVGVSATPPAPRQSAPAEPIPAPPSPPLVPEPTPSSQPVTEKPAAPVATGEPDNLLKIKGIGPKVNAVLNGLGITRFEQIAAWTDAELAEIDRHLGNFAGRPVRDQWIEQARYLASGDIAGFEAKFGKL